MNIGADRRTLDDSSLHLDGSVVVVSTIIVVFSGTMPEQKNSGKERRQVSPPPRIHLIYISIL